MWDTERFGPPTRGQVTRSSTVHIQGHHTVYEQIGQSVLCVDYTDREFERLVAIRTAKIEREDTQAKLYLDLYHVMWKVCARCGFPKAYTDYYMGHTSYCKDCMRAMQRERMTAARVAV